jgi:hypothetical protein
LLLYTAKSRGRALDENWSAPEWEEWEVLRPRFHELGVDLEPVGEPPNIHAVTAYWKTGGWIAASPLDAEAPTLPKALHRLAKEVSAALREEHAAG